MFARLRAVQQGDEKQAHRMFLEDLVHSAHHEDDLLYLVALDGQVHVQRRTASLPEDLRWRETYVLNVVCHLSCTVTWTSFSGASSSRTVYASPLAMEALRRQCSLVNVYPDVIFQLPQDSMWPVQLNPKEGLHLKIEHSRVLLFQDTVRFEEVPRADGQVRNVGLSVRALTKHKTFGGQSMVRSVFVEPAFIRLPLARITCALLE